LSVILLLCIGVFSFLLFFPHITWDDPEMVFANEDVRSFRVSAFFTNQYQGNYIPVTMLFHALAWKLFGAADWGHHLFSLVFHLLNGFLVYRLSRLIFRKDLVALCAPVIFLLHPVQVESIAWIAELKTPVCGFFFLSGLLRYAAFLKNKRYRDYFLALLLFILACLGKPSAIAFPFCLAGLYFLTDDFFIREKRRIVFRHFLLISPFILIALTVGLLTLKTQQEAQFINFAHAFPFWQRIGMAGYAVCRYLFLVIFPFMLSVIYPYPVLSGARLLIGYVAVISLVSLAVFLFSRKKRGYLFCLSFVVLTLLPVLQLIPFGESLYADRYLYLPLVGVGLVVALRFAEMLTLRGVFMLGFILALLSCIRVQRWKTALTLYEDVLHKYPDYFVALNSAAVEYLRINEDSKAMDLLDRAVLKAPDNYKVWYNRGLVFLKMHKPQQAVSDFNRAVTLFDYRKAYTARASAWYMQGDYRRAREDAERALVKDPRDANAYFVKANCFNDQNVLDSALTNYNRCISLRPDEAEYYLKRSVVFGKRKQFRESLADLNQCIIIRPDHYEAYYWRAVSKMNLGMDGCRDLAVSARNNFGPAADAYNRYCR
jgi:tetratricopeptide (TPR) repeat protein